MHDEDVGRIIDLLTEILATLRGVAQSLPDYVVDAAGRKVWPVRQWGSGFHDEPIVARGGEE